MSKIAFILHGKYKGLKKLKAEVERFFTGYEVEFRITEHENHSIELAYRAIKDDATHVICVGGDGSLNEVANGVMKAKTENPACDVRIGVLPHGTGNDFAKTIQISDSVASLRQLIDKDSCCEIDLGHTEFTAPDGKRGSRYFINITDIGMGGTIAQKLVNSSKIFGPTFTYQKAILTTLFTYKNQPIKVTADSFNYQGKVLNFIIANGKYFGSGLGIAPDASPVDGEFAIVIAGEISMLDYIMNLGTVRKCQRVNHPELKYLSAKEISIESLTDPLPIDMDGEFIGYSPFKIKVVPKAVKFLCPL